MDDPLSFKEYALFYSTGLFGIACSITSIILIVKKPFLHHAFGYICAAQSVVEAGVVGSFVFSGAYSVIRPEANNTIVGHILVFCYFTGLYLHLLKSLNRFCAIVFSMKYRIWFSERIIKIFILIAFGMGFLNASPLFWYECSAYFSGETYYLATITHECESKIIFFDDFVTSCTTMTISISCDFIAFTYYRMRFKTANVNSQLDYKLALHAYFTTLLYLAMEASFWLFSRFATNRWTSFLTTTFAWLSCHTLNQLSFIIFVKYLQQKIKIVPIASSS